jgi:hypothetical protein
MVEPGLHLVEHALVLKLASWPIANDLWTDLERLAAEGKGGVL